MNNQNLTFTMFKMIRKKIQAIEILFSHPASLLCLQLKVQDFEISLLKTDLIFDGFLLFGLSCAP